MKELVLAENQPERRALRVYSDTGLGEKEIDLSGIPAAEFFKNDIVRYQITGTLPVEPNYRIVNFVGCTLHDITADTVNFSECDFKDSVIKSAQFTNCRFDGGAFATTFISYTVFTGCTFYNLSAHNCDFQDVRFVDCDLSNLLIKSSRFSRCIFERCLTVNKICEMSTLFNVVFDRTPLQIDTITSNFGITRDNLHSTSIRTGRTRDSYTTLDPDQITGTDDFQEISDLSPLERLSLEYFVNGSIIEGSWSLDEALNLTRWTRIYKNPGSFVELLNKFAEFLVHIYDEGQLTLQPVLLLHHITSTLTQSIRQDEQLHQVLVALGGVHLMLSRIVEDFLSLLDVVSREVGTQVRFRVEGPEDTSYFANALQPWLADGVEVARVTRNSPLVLELSAAKAEFLLPLLGAFIATRTRLEITQLNTALEKKRRFYSTQSPRKRLSDGTQIGTSIFSIATGPSQSPSAGFELKVRALMPGSLLIDLKLDFSTTLIRKLRAILLMLLTDTITKA